ncbi:MAG: hypothetical protein ABSF45_20120 [Terriglobia bacterium]|jgi:hypothetical protein
MRILLDSRDLINLAEHDRPITTQQFDAYLRARDYETVLSFTNVRELASPLASGVEFMEVRPHLLSLERLPNTYLKETTIVAIEIQAAVEAFNSGTEYRGCSPYVTRWDRTLVMLPGQERSATDNWVNLRLDEIVFYINHASPHVFAPPAQHLATLQAVFQNDRAALRAGRAPARQHFVSSVRKHAASFGVPLPRGREDEFAEWVYTNPDRCPGLRLNHETYRALMGNYTDIPETADFSDLAHISALPYVEVATMDRRMTHYCGVASRKIVTFGGGVNYADRLCRDITDLMQQYP